MLDEGMLYRQLCSSRRSWLCPDQAVDGSSLCRRHCVLLQSRALNHPVAGRPVKCNLHVIDLYKWQF